MEIKKKILVQVDDIAKFSLKYIQKNVFICLCQFVSW